MVEALTTDSCSIVLIEDLPDYVAITQKVLELDGHRVWAATDSQTGFTAVVDNKPDLAFIDLGMPQVDGYQVARRVRQAGLKTYLVALTALGGDKVKVQCLEAGFDRHILKPLLPDERRDVIRRALQRKRGLPES